MFDSFLLDVEGMGFSTEKSAVWYLGHNRKPLLGFQLFQCSFPEIQVKLKANVAVPQISNYSVMDHTYCTMYSSWFLEGEGSVLLQYVGNYLPITTVSNPRRPESSDTKS